MDYLSWVIYLSDLLVILVLGLWFTERQVREGGWRNILEGWRKAWNPKRYCWLLLVVLVLVINVCVALRPEVAIYGVFSWLVVAGLAVFVARNKIDKWLGWGLVVGLGLNLFLSVMQVLGQRSLGGMWWWWGERTFSIATGGIARWEWGNFVGLRPYGTFSHPNSMGGFALIAAVVMWGLKTGKRVKYIGLVLAVVLAGLSFSQAVWGGLVLAGVSWWWLKKDCVWRRWVLVGIVGGMVMVGTVGELLFSYQASFWERRHILAAAAVKMVQERPIWGVGMDNFVVGVADKLTKNESVYWLQPVHNGILLVLAETGLVGGGIFLWGVVKLVKRAVRQKEKMYLVALLVTFWLATWDHYVLTLQQNQLLLGILIGILVRRENILYSEEE